MSGNQPQSLWGRLEVSPDAEATIGQLVLWYRQPFLGVFNRLFFWFRRPLDGCVFLRRRRRWWWDRQLVCEAGQQLKH